MRKSGFNYAKNEGNGVKIWIISAQYSIFNKLIKKKATH
jgi:hypothetical protein